MSSEALRAIVVLELRYAEPGVGAPAGVKGFDRPLYASL